MAKKTRLKADAVDAPQTKEQVQALIKQLGDNQREFTREETAMNDEIALVTEQFEPRLNELQSKIKAQFTAIQTWSEANRSEITDKKKSVKLLTGTIGWRMKTASVSIKGKDDVIARLKKNKRLKKFIRTKYEIDKPKMLLDRTLASTVDGVTINTGDEEFYITPFEAEMD